MQLYTTSGIDSCNNLSESLYFSIILGYYYIKLPAQKKISYFARDVPRLFIFLDVSPPEADIHTVLHNHSLYFFADESVLLTGMQALESLVIDYIAMQANRYIPEKAVRSASKPMPAAPVRTRRLHQKSSANICTE